MSMPHGLQKFKRLAPHERERAFQAADRCPPIATARVLCRVGQPRQSEKGNDVIFAEIDRLHGYVYYGMQVKYLDQIG